MHMMKKLLTLAAAAMVVLTFDSCEKGDQFAGGDWGIMSLGERPLPGPH